VFEENYQRLNTHQKEMLRDFAEGGDKKRRAVSIFLRHIRESLQSCIVETEDYETLQLFWALRRLYVPGTYTDRTNNLSVINL